MNRRLVFAITVLVAMMLPFAIFGQDKKGGKMSMAPMSVTGCFNKGADATHYKMVDDKGKEIVVMGDAAMLDGHAKNHNVTLTGTMGKDGTVTVLKVTDLKMNSMCK
jgi:hypothetical protein